MPRLLLLSSEFPPGPGGIGTHAYQVANTLARSSWSVQVVSPQDYAGKDEIEKFNKAQNFGIQGLPPYRFKPLQDYKRFWITKKMFQSFKPDLVMASGARAIWLSALLSGWYSIPWVLVGHGKEFGSWKGMGAWITRFAGNRAIQAICVSRFTEEAMRDFGIGKPSSLVIHNGADHNRFFPLSPSQIDDFRRTQNVSDVFVLLTVGSVSDRKGQEVVIRALPEIQQNHPNVQYWMAGLPWAQEKLERLARDLNVRENIRFWGRVPDEILLNLYNACDLFVMTSRKLVDGDFEGYGIAVIEAALCGKTALVSANSGLEEAVQNGVTGLIVPQDDPASTAEAVLKLIRNPEMRKTLSKNAHQIAAQNQTWDEVTKKYRVLFKEILNKQTSS